MEGSGTPLDRQPRASSNLWRWLILLGATAVAGGAYIAGRSARPAVISDAHASRVLYYVDPMHPAYRSDRPGQAPDCGMKLVPVYDDARGQRPAPDPGTLTLTPGQQQAAQLQTETVQRGSGSRTLHTVGRVAPDEALTYRVTAGTDGWVRRVFADQTGTRVKRGDKLSSFLTREISASQQAYVYALESYDRVRRNPSPPPDQLTLAERQLATTRDALLFLGFGDAQLAELGRTRREIVDIDVTAPADGQILERHVGVGQRFTKGDLLYRIANLARVWVLADVRAGDTVWRDDVRSAQVRVEGGLVAAKVATVPPEFDEQGRTGRLRLEVNNPRGILQPGMIVDVDLGVAAAPALTVHADAVIDSGTTRRVFVVTSSGRYERRDVETGWQQGDRIEIRSGLAPGERVVTGGAFLLDSESRMKPASNQP